MKKSFFFLLFCLVSVAAGAENVEIRTGNTSLVVKAEKGKPAEFVYYGAALSAADMENIDAANVTTKHQIYPAFGLMGDRPTALSLNHSDGNMTTRLLFDSFVLRQEADGSVYSFLLKDEIYNLAVSVNYRVRPATDVLETWTEITNGEKGDIVLREYASAFLPLRAGDLYLSYLTGARCAECRIQTEKVRRGLRVIEGVDGVRTTHLTHAEAIFSLDGQPCENSGATIGATLLYTGNTKLKVNWIDEDYVCFSAGIHSDNSAYRLGRGKTFTTPVLALCWSGEGVGGVSRQFHSWGRRFHLCHGDQPRPVVLNSWEGVTYDVRQSVMEDMMDDASYIGVELFVMDDGWFGGKYQRDDTAALGDWTVDRRKLPDGVQPLVDYSNRQGLKFGIWIEPEMVNDSSELYLKHPDWVIKGKGREVTKGRGASQMILDLGNPEVQEFVFNVVDNILQTFDNIYYIKWDANMTQADWGSQYLPADSQSHLQIEYHKGFAKVCDRIREKYPDVVMQACASGGGRVNWGYLGWFDEFWTSDNTDAMQRIWMQWGTSLFYPAIAMASHVSAVPNAVNSRTTSLKFRIDVAMSGRMGVELQPKDMTQWEKEQVRKAVGEYKTYLRPIVQLGEQYRLVSPYDGLNVASLMYVSPDKSEAAFFWWRLDEMCDDHLPRVKMDGLNPDALYCIKEMNVIDDKPLPFEGKIFSGRFLMECGLEMPPIHNCPVEIRGNNSSRVLFLELCK